MDVSAGRAMKIDSGGEKTYAVMVRISKIEKSEEADKIVADLYEKATELTGQTILD